MGEGAGNGIGEKGPIYGGEDFKVRRGESAAVLKWLNCQNLQVIFEWDHIMRDYYSIPPTLTA